MSKGIRKNAYAYHAGRRHGGAFEGKLAKKKAAILEREENEQVMEMIMDTLICQCGEIYETFEDLENCPCSITDQDLSEEYVKYQNEMEDNDDIPF